MNAETLGNIVAVWLTLGGCIGFCVGIFLDDLLDKKVSPPARVFAGVFTLLFGVLIIPWYLTVGARDLYRTLRPKKVELPKARVL